MLLKAFGKELKQSCDKEMVEKIALQGFANLGKGLAILRLDDVPVVL